MENIYETLQNMYIRPYLPGVIHQTIDTTATIKNEIINPVEPEPETETEPEPEPETETEKKKTICSICGGKYSYFNKKRHESTQKHLSALPSSPPLVPPPVVIPYHAQSLQQ
jgi:hypothetical protein